MKKNKNLRYDFFNIVSPEINEISIIKKGRYSYLKAFVLFFGIIILSIIFIQWIYSFDNKYTASGPRGEKGKIFFTEEDFTKEPLFFLIDGWQFYPQKLLTPDELKQEESLPTEVFIGQYPDFALGDLNGSPTGQGTYTMTIEYLGKSQILSMEIPEILSSAKIWINGNLVKTLGNPEEKEYLPFVKNTVIDFNLESRTEIVIETGNYNHYISGVYYPPVIGIPEAVDGMLFSRLLFYSILCTLSSLIGIFTLGLSFFPKRHPLYFFYGIMALAFGIHVSYPFVRWIGVPFPELFYAIEDASWFVMVLSVLAINLFVSGFWHQNKLKNVILSLGVFMALFTIVVPLFILPQQPKLVNWYGVMIDTYSGFIFLILVFTSVIGMINKKSHQYLLLAGNTVFGFTIIFKVTSSNLFEPIYGGWQVEYGGLLIIILFGILTMRVFKNILSVNQYLTEKLEEEVEIRTQELLTLMDERKKLLSGIAHDIKAPLSSIQAFASLVKEGNVLLDDEVKSYLLAIDQKSNDIQNRVRDLQNLPNTLNTKRDEDKISLNGLLGEVYENAEMDANAAGINFHLELPKETVFIRGNEAEITSALENIIYNALSFTELNGTIKMKLKVDKNEAQISIEDTGCGIPEEYSDKIFEPYFSVRNEKISNIRGLGLYLVKECVEKHEGKISVKSEIGVGSKFVISLKIE